MTQQLNHERFNKAGESRPSVQDLQDAGKEVTNASNSLASIHLGRLNVGASTSSSAPVSSEQGYNDIEGSEQGDNELAEVTGRFFDDEGEEEDRATAEKVLGVGPLGEATTGDVVLALMRQNYGRLQGQRRLQSFIEVVEGNPWHRCPLCPLPDIEAHFGGSHRDVGKISADRSNQIRHLRDLHPTEYAIFATGGLLAEQRSFVPGTFATTEALRCIT
ncbi:unnamed protein product [Tilletia controversa]|uniref:Uncharacterized protein n=3 Tax=Tilletia TaxID=13289 RepID=A0A8X7MKH2_9BASI|nr:hypothetical protein CF335_g7306 [Tilletia laevis]KAE8239612.1 hypothetical protein A4X06_0g8175 [Tilletia controversa]KAE8246502.1 hypothetical protein A4X03_0g7253 [Tilletia caries]CAD6886235.1 unnamed protein product [Tilletia caries]CAD6903580.1 unnamed protein product [Tilletia laevis]